MTVRTKPYVTPEEYLALERAAETRSEYLNGEIIGLTGASRRHSLITLNVGSELARQVEDRPCEFHVNDLRALIASRCPYSYLDVIVVFADPASTEPYSDPT